ncbi:MAG TPA: transposase [Nevskiaceae bacterium]|nr:transposase [Nevskiaceae bacterium]
MARKRQQDWEKHLAALAAEGMTVRAYAQQHGLRPAALYKWRHRLKQQADKRALTIVAKPVRAKKANAPVATVTVVERGHDGLCRLTLAPGVQLELSQLPSPEWLAAVTAALAPKST